MTTSPDKPQLDRLTTIAELRPLIETAADDALPPVVLRAFEVVDFPKRDQAIPLAEELTGPQRELAEILAGRANVNCLSMHAIPKKVQQRRRWLGIDPPSLLERPVTLSVGAETLERPLWWACNYLVERKEGELIPSLISREELFHLAVEVSLWRSEIYGIGFGYPASCSARTSSRTMDRRRHGRPTSSRRSPPGRGRSPLGANRQTTCRERGEEFGSSAEGRPTAKRSQMRTSSRRGLCCRSFRPRRSQTPFASCSNHRR